MDKPLYKVSDGRLVADYVGSHRSVIYADVEAESLKALGFMVQAYGELWHERQELQVEIDYYREQLARRMVRAKHWRTPGWRCTFCHREAENCKEIEHAAHCPLRDK